MEAKASLRYLRITPRKVRAVADLIRGKKVDQALAQLAFVEKRAAEPMAKLLRSAVANAELTAKDQSLDVDRLHVKSLMVDQGPSLRRYMPRAMGRAFKVLKKTSHISLVISDESKKRAMPASPVAERAKAQPATGEAAKAQPATKKKKGRS
ncbi:MAG: 50S ribosomal protein L22 [Deltaproteobacteria bacterium]|nr:MAG: 50S ribosomal protein L22 [Deltaproteobacteria bacterium]